MVNIKLTLHFHLVGQRDGDFADAGRANVTRTQGQRL